MMYDPYFGNPIKFPNGQRGTSINLFRNNISEMFRRDNNLSVKFVCYDSARGFSPSKPAFSVAGLTTERKKLSKVGNSKTVPKYDWLNPLEDLFYCIKSVDGKYYLYDWDMGNPLKYKIGDTTFKSGKAPHTITIIKNLPPGKIVHALKFSAVHGLEQNNEKEFKLGTTPGKLIKHKMLKDALDKNKTNRKLLNKKMKDRIGEKEAGRSTL